MTRWLSGGVQRGQALVEYGLIIVAVVVIAIAGLSFLATAQQTYITGFSTRVAPTPGIANPTGATFHITFVTLNCTVNSVAKTATCTATVTDTSTMYIPSTGSIQWTVTSLPPLSCTIPSTCSGGNSDMRTFSFLTPGTYTIQVQDTGPFPPGWEQGQPVQQLIIVS
jgi:hypothetical protein